jgi:hypothetical protein
MLYHLNVKYIMLIKRKLFHIKRYSHETFIFTQSMTWPVAREFCRSKGMDLVAIESFEENEAIAGHGRALGGKFYNIFFLSKMWFTKLLHNSHQKKKNQENLNSYKNLF